MYRVWPPVSGFDIRATPAFVNWKVSLEPNIVLVNETVSSMPNESKVILDIWGSEDGSSGYRVIDSAVSRGLSVGRERRR